MPSFIFYGSFPALVREKGPSIESMPVLPLEKFGKTGNEGYANINTNGIMIMKVDTEGNEKLILAGTKQFFKTKPIKYAIVEVTPCYEFRGKAGIEPNEVREIVSEILSCSYAMVSLWDFNFFAQRRKLSSI